MTQAIDTYALDWPYRYRPVPQSKPIKPRQVWLDTLRSIQEHIWSHGYPPTRRELQGALGLRSCYAVTLRVQRAAQFGLIELDPKENRGLRLTDAGVAALAWSPPLYVERRCP